MQYPSSTAGCWMEEPWLGGGRGEGGKQPRGGEGRHCCVAAEVPRGGSF
jgi:hypothetical protein